MHEHSRKQGDARHKTAMAAFAENSSPDVSERNSMAITLNIHAKSHTVRSRPTLDSFNPSRGWVLCVFVTLPISVVLFTQITMLYH